MAPSAPPGEIPEHRAKSETQTLPGVAPSQPIKYLGNASCFLNFPIKDVIPIFYEFQVFTKNILLQNHYSANLQNL